jgi:hypothetical protein
MTYRLGSAAIAFAACLCPSFAAGFTPTIRFSEFLLDSPGTDDGREYFEISGPAGASLDGLFLLEIEGDGGASGVIDGVFDLTGLSLGSNGLLLLRDQEMIPVGELMVPGVLNPAPAAETTVYYENNPPLGDYNRDGVVNAADYTVYRDLAAAGTGTLPNDATTGSIGAEDYTYWAGAYTGNGPVRAFFNRDGDVENGSITMAIVRDFTGVLNQDLDTNDDGALDATPWSEVLDAVGMNEGTMPEDTGLLNNSYGAQLGGIDFASNPVDGLQAIPGFSDEPDGYILLEDGQGGYIRAVLEPNESTSGSPDIYFDDGSGVPQVVDTAPLGPWTLDNAANPGGYSEIVTVDENGVYYYVDPELVLVTGEMLGFPGVSIVDADGNPLSLFLVSPGNLNGSGVVAEPVFPAASLGVPEPSTVVVALLAALTSTAASRRR